MLLKGLGAVPAWPPLPDWDSFLLMEKNSAVQGGSRNRYMNCCRKNSSKIPEKQTVPLCECVTCVAQSNGDVTTGELVRKCEMTLTNWCGTSYVLLRSFHATRRMLVLTPAVMGVCVCVCRERSQPCWFHYLLNELSHVLTECFAAGPLALPMSIERV